jgi:hypothetical protein
LYNVPWSGNAKDWLTGAENAGWTVTQTPAIGDIAVFQPGADGALAPYGHVALVTSVTGGNQFGISEMNATAGLDKVDNREVTTGSGVGFIVPPASADNVTALTAALGQTPPNMLNGASPAVPTTTETAATSGTSGVLGFILGALGLSDVGTFFLRGGLIIVGVIMFIVGLRIAFAAQAQTIIQQGQQAGQNDQAAAEKARKPSRVKETAETAAVAE